MTSRRHRFLTAIGLLGLVVALGAGLAGAGSASVARVNQADVVRLTATLTPTSGSGTTVTWNAIMVFRRGHGGQHTEKIPCLTRPRRPNEPVPPPKTNCPTTRTDGSPVRPAHWDMVWWLSSSSASGSQLLSSQVTGVDLRIAATKGAAPTVAATLCSTACTATTTPSRTSSLTTDQASAVLDGRGSVVVHTSAGELSGSIVRLSFAAAARH